MFETAVPALFFLSILFTVVIMVPFSAFYVWIYRTRDSGPIRFRICTGIFVFSLLCTGFVVTISGLGVAEIQRRESFCSLIVDKDYAGVEGRLKEGQTSADCWDEFHESGMAIAKMNQDQRMVDLLSKYPDKQ